MYKYLFLICFGIIIFMLLNDIDTFNIGSQRYITTDCDDDYQVADIIDYWTEGYKTSNNIHYIDIITFGNKTYKLSVVLTDKVIDFMEYSSDVTSKNDINFARNLCRLLEKIQYVIGEMCKNLKEIYIQQIATLYIEDGIEHLLTKNDDVNTLKDIRNIYIYLDYLSKGNMTQYIWSHAIIGQENNYPTDIKDENICDICAFNYLREFADRGMTTYNNRDFCEPTDMTGLFGGIINPSNVISLSDVYHFDPEASYPPNNFRPYNSIVLVHEFAHNIMENGIANGEPSKREEFNDIYDIYKNYVDTNCLHNNNDDCLSCNDIYACFGNCSTGSNNPELCDYKGSELFAIASETWFSVNLDAENSNVYIDTLQNIENLFPDLYRYLETVYGPPNNLCENQILQHYQICQQHQPSVFASTESTNSNFIIPVAIGFLAFLTGANACATRRNTQNEYTNLKCGDVPGEV
jgi:hypothetical protein